MRDQQSPPTTDIVSALVVEDTPTIAKLVQRGLLLEGIHAEIAADGNAALAAIRDTSPDLVVLDLMLPGVDGMEICRRIRAADAAAGRKMATLVLMLTARDTVADRVNGLDAGADDYLAKPFAIDEFLARVRALLRRRTATGPEREGKTLRFGDLSVDLGSRLAYRRHRLLKLTTREFDLLTYFLRNPNHVLQHDQIIERVWGDDFFGESNVLAVTIANLRREIEQPGEPRLLQTVRGVGYVLREQLSREQSQARPESRGT
jgi:two-component system response regulator MprA